MNQRERTDWIIEQIGQVNPYRRQQQNRRMEFYIYNMGYSAAVLASFMEQDPELARQFRQHIESQRRFRPN